MSDDTSTVRYETELQPGEELRLPKEVIASIGPGRWRVTIEPVQQQAVRSHSAFLNGYSPEDEGLYDVDTPR